MLIRSYQDADAAAVNRVAIRAFQQFAGAFDDWELRKHSIAQLASLASETELIVAEMSGVACGAVGYGPPGMPRPDFFRPEWAIVRMLVVDPAARGLGIGRALTMECIRRALRDAAGMIALHTSPIMTVALPMYERMGFTHQYAVAPRGGVPYAVYALRLDGQEQTSSPTGRRRTTPGTGLR